MIELRVTRREARVGRRERYAPCLFSHLAPRASRLAVTLVELLVTMAIIAILGTALLGASRVAMEGARKARTKMMVIKLHTLLMERYESYQTRRVDIESSITQDIEKNFSGNDRGKALADVRLLATRELMKLEMPDRWSDITGDVVGNPYRDQTSSPKYPRLIQDRPSLTKAYLRRYLSLDQSVGTKVIEQNEGAECLYMIIMLATGDGEARTLFSQQDIGDTDGDGAPEFLDGWKRPIHFVRWPAGFVNESELMSGDADADHDPFDPFRRDQQNTGSSYSWLSDNEPAYRLVPLIFSNGSDGDSDINVPRDIDVTTPPSTRPLDPYASIYDGEKLGLAADRDGDGEGWHDNIHNHLLD